jgi:tetratricopeptide (TPR) repeat protein
LESTPTGAPVQLDGALIGTTPLDLLVSPGDHVLSAPGLPTSTVHIAASERLEKSWVTQPASTPSAMAATPREPRNDIASPPAPAPADLLADARAARARGDNASAAQAYRSLLASHPDSPEATAATLSLAELELGRGANQEALTLYERYISRRGPLMLEARYGKVRALRALGRSADAQQEAASFVHDYPDSPQADALR